MDEELQFQKIQFYDDELGGIVEFFVIETTKVNETQYLLATQELGEESDAYLFKVLDEKAPDGSEIVIELVEDETEMEAVGKVFAELLSDNVDIEF